jgi:hypothetical protein
MLMMCNIASTFVVCRNIMRSGVTCGGHMTTRYDVIYDAGMCVCVCVCVLRS